MREIAELICAPKTHQNEVAYLKVLLEEYVSLQKRTLRFKHCYFKDCAIKPHNFIHLSKTLAERHQLLQTYLGQGHLFPAHIQIAGEANEIVERSYNRDIQMVLNTSDIDKQKNSEVSAVTYKGTKYTKGLVVALEHTGETLVFGKISLILSDERNVFFVVLVHRSVLLVDLGVYYLVSDNKYAYINADSLQDYYPLPMYNILDFPTVCLHHSVCSSF